MYPAIPIALVFLGCCSNVIFLELIVGEVPTAGTVITFAQFLFIAVEGFLFTVKFGTVKPKIPLTTYGTMVTLFFVVSVSNNAAFSFDIPMPLHIIFRAGSLMASLILGVIILKRQYPFYKIFAVMLITIGIVISTIASANTLNSSHETKEDDIDIQTLVHWTLGLSLLVFALFLTARMGIYQEVVYKRHGKHPSEALFYNHALPLPAYIFFAKDIYRHVLIFSSSSPLTLPIIGLSMPKLWVYLLGNCITQYICIRAVFILTTECRALTVTLIVTLRKFVSLVFSIMYFLNPFTFYHWIGAVLVFGGTLLFTEVFHRLRDTISPKDKVE